MVDKLKFKHYRNHGGYCGRAESDVIVNQFSARGVSTRKRRIDCPATAVMRESPNLFVLGAGTVN